jgi:DNA ligase-1
VRFSELVATSAAVADVSSRTRKIGRLAELLRQLGTEEIEAAVAFLSGTMRQGRLGVGYQTVAAAVVSPAQHPMLEILDVDTAFGALAGLSGKGSARERAQLLGNLLRRATSAEQGFIQRLLSGELRQGALEGVLVDALAKASTVPAAKLRRAAMMAGSLGPVAQAALTQGEQAVDAFAIRLMSPLRPMLAEPAESLDEALSRLEEVSLEYKLDGARIQVHKSDEDIRVYTRTLNDVTPSVPEVVTIVRAMPARQLILDGEVLALRPDGRPYPFQESMRRFGRRRDVEQGQAQLPLTPFFFDLLYADGHVLIDEPLERRAARLHELAPRVEVPRLSRPDHQQAEDFAREALARGHEGIMAKALEAPYAAGRRGAAWLKIKNPRTLDLVVLAAEWGHGRRGGWLSNLHLGARDPDTNGFVMLGKTFKGMTDEMLAWQTKALLSREIGRDGITVHVRPELVVEIAFNDVQTSSVYPGGVALRFARVKRYRTDKTAAEADTIQAVRSLL